MKKMYPLILSLALALGATLPAHATGEQQAKMKECNTQAKGKHGAERKAFMKQCLSGTAAAAPMDAAKPVEAAPASKAEEAKPAAGEKKLTAQQMKMKECNVNAKGMKGDERKKFMKECLSKKK
ncbi:MAG: PsiF repeat protein [Ferrovum sp.]|nr:PsiF repeat protein [Ferrovum sp.]NDU87432.1 PsiF repeat protein [Ferrovum sp.]